MTSRLDRALQTATDTRAILVGAGVLDEAGGLIAEHLPGRPVTLVADENTWEVAGERVRESLIAVGVEVEESFVFPGAPTLYADYVNVERLRDALAAGDSVPVVLGAGTLNDICKLAAGELGRPYAVVGTAASMDGYAAFGASITRDGFKITRECPAPIVIVAPLDVMAAAPQRLTASGLGDLIEKVPGGADWIVADELGIEPIDEGIWNLVQAPLPAALADPSGLARGDRAAIGALGEGLLMSGLAMQAHQSSRPASGAGHNFSHQWEMEGHGLDWEPPLSHGFKVGLGTVALCALYEAVQRLDLTTVDVDARLTAWPTPEQDAARVAALQSNPTIREAAIAQSAAKYVPRSQAPARLEAIRAAWPAILERIAPQLRSAKEIVEALEAVGGIHHPSQIGIDLDRLRLTYFQAQTIRSRYTVLDLLQEAGLLNEVVDGLFAPGGYWSERPRPIR